MFGTSKDIKYPGLNILPPGVERHVVNGGALTAVRAPPLTTCRSTPGGKIFKPGYLMSLLVPNIFNFFILLYLLSPILLFKYIYIF